jgi:hypothetical protein
MTVAIQLGTKITSLLIARSIDDKQRLKNWE